MENEEIIVFLLDPSLNSLFAYIICSLSISSLLTWWRNQFAKTTEFYANATQNQRFVGIPHINLFIPPRSFNLSSTLTVKLWSRNKGRTRRQTGSEPKGVHGEFNEEDELSWSKRMVGFANENHSRERMAADTTTYKKSLENENVFIHERLYVYIHIYMYNVCKYTCMLTKMN